MTNKRNSTNPAPRTYRFSGKATFVLRDDDDGGQRWQRVARGVAETAIADGRGIEAPADFTSRKAPAVALTPASPPADAGRPRSTATKDGEMTCGGACGRTLAVTKFPTTKDRDGRVVRVGRCRECRDAATAARAAAAAKAAS